MPWRREFVRLLVVLHPLRSLGGNLMYSINYSLLCPSDFLPPPSPQITVYIRASILSGARSHVPDIKLLMKYLLGLQAPLQPAPKTST